MKRFAAKSVCKGRGIFCPHWGKKALESSGLPLESTNCLSLIWNLESHALWFLAKPERVRRNDRRLCHFKSGCFVSSFVLLLLKTEEELCTTHRCTYLRKKVTNQHATFVSLLMEVSVPDRVLQQRFLDHFYEQQQLIHGANHVARGGFEVVNECSNNRQRRFWSLSALLKCNDVVESQKETKVSQLKSKEGYWWIDAIVAPPLFSTKFRVNQSMPLSHDICSALYIIKHKQTCENSLFQDLHKSTQSMHD